MTSKFSEEDIEKFYDAEDEIYRSFWDEKGSLHWGYFGTKKETYLDASSNLTNIIAKKARINSYSNVLDVGCGNGAVDIYLAKKFGCKIIGIDLSGVRISNALKNLENEPIKIKDKTRFKKASATNLPFKDEEFSHIFIQATIYHVHDKIKALKEIYRVLKDGGIFVIDDLTKPKKEISRESQKYVYDRLLYNTDFSFESYKETLKDLGFTIHYSEDISHHLKRSYEELIKILKEKIKERTSFEEKYKKLIISYEFMIKAVDKKELGWGLFLCKK